MRKEDIKDVADVVVPLNERNVAKWAKFIIACGTAGTILWGLVYGMAQRSDKLDQAYEQLQQIKSQNHEPRIRALEVIAKEHSDKLEKMDSKLDDLRDGQATTQGGLSTLLQDRGYQPLPTKKSK